MSSPPMPLSVSSLMRLWIWSARTAVCWRTSCWSALFCKIEFLLASCAQTGRAVSEATRSAFPAKRPKFGRQEDFFMLSPFVRVLFTFMQS